jgi:hypothetical protein
MKPTFSYGFLMAFLCDSVSGGAGFSHFSAPRTSSSVSFITRPKPGIGLARPWKDAAKRKRCNEVGEIYNVGPPR